MIGLCSEDIKIVRRLLMKFCSRWQWNNIDSYLAQWIYYLATESSIHNSFQQIFLLSGLLHLPQVIQLDMSHEVIEETHTKVTYQPSLVCYILLQGGLQIWMEHSILARVIVLVFGTISQQLIIQFVFLIFILNIGPGLEQFMQGASRVLTKSSHLELVIS